MNVGKVLRVYRVEPLTNPVPAKKPPEPQKEGPSPVRSDLTPKP